MKFVEKIYSLHYSEFDRITSVSGKKRPYFTKNKNELRLPKKISNSNYFVESNLSANNIVSIIKEVLRVFNYDENVLKIKLNNQL